MQTDDYAENGGEEIFTNRHCILITNHKGFYTGYLKIIVPSLCSYCGGAIGSYVSVFTQLHLSGFNLEFETLFKSI